MRQPVAAVVLGAILLIGGGFYVYNNMLFPPPGAQVNCTGNGITIQCSVTHTSGASSIQACWDLVFQCNNGSQSKAHGCQNVSPSQTAVYVFRDEDIKGAERCDSVRSSLVTNVTVTD